MRHATPAIALVLSVLGGAAPAIAIPLQVGSYSSDTATVRIAGGRDRLCYWAATTRGTLTASVSHHPDYFDFYEINEVDLALHQPDPQTLLIGEVHSLLTYDRAEAVGGEIPARLVECLEAEGSFFQQETLEP